MSNAPSLATDWARLRENFTGIHVQKVEMEDKPDSNGWLITVDVVRRDGQFAPLVIGLMLHRFRENSNYLWLDYVDWIDPIGFEVIGDRLVFHIFKQRDLAYEWYEKIRAIDEHTPTAVEKWLLAGIGASHE